MRAEKQYMPTINHAHPDDAEAILAVQKLAYES
jgi:hypothetical protein